MLANSLFNVSGASIMVGLSAGMETLCGQAHGARQYRSLGVVLQRALLICWLTALPICALWAHAAPLLRALGQPPAIADGAALYLHAAAPCIFLIAITECLKRYLLAQVGIIKY